MNAVHPNAPSLKAATARILVGDTDATAGTGWLWVGGFVATCAHVVRFALGIGNGSSPGPGACVRLRFPFADAGGEPLDAEVAGFRADADVAILRIRGKPPYTFGWLNNYELRDDDAFDVDCFGFGPAEETAEARVPTNAIDRHEASLRRRNTDDALTVEGGFSGAPVYDGDMRVIGLLRGARDVQGRQVARIVLSKFVIAAFHDAWNARRATVGGLDPAPVLEAARAGIKVLAERTNARRLIEAMECHLNGLAATLTDPDAVGEVCEYLRGVEQAVDEARRNGLDRFSPGLCLGSLPVLLTGLRDRARAPDGGCLVPNDWDTNENLPHASDVDKLLREIDARMAFLDRPRPGVVEETARREMRGRLARLKRLLYGDPLSLAEIDAVRADLERLDRDVFSALIRLCQVFLGRHAGALPDLAVFRDGADGPEMVVIPTGTFLMGSPDDEEGIDEDEGPRRLVTIDARFAVGRYPVTFEEYERFSAATKGETPNDEGWGTGRRPVINVSWEDAQAFLAWLSRETGAEYRLPGEAEWEYACRAGEVKAWCFGDDVSKLPAFAWFGENSDGRTHPVGEKRPNRFGLHDMHGNVWEWGEDAWHDRSSNRAVRIIRGGSWSGDARNVRSACRPWNRTDNRSGDLGFRCARVLVSRAGG